jgi:hypothetical protein
MDDLIKAATLVNLVLISALTLKKLMKDEDDGKK